MTQFSDPQEQQSQCSITSLYSPFFPRKKMQPEIFFLALFCIQLVSTADLLKNSDFENLPSNIPQNSTIASPVLLGGNSTIPGWTFEGTVFYITASETTRLPDNIGHALQLGQDGKINQSFIVNGDNMNYILTFTLVSEGRNCSTTADLVVSAPDSYGVFSIKQGYGRETWQRYGHYLGMWGQEEKINLVIESKTTETDANSTCWPIIDSILVKAIETPVQDADNLVPNSGFELGPGFSSNSTEGVLLNQVSSPVQSPLLQWSISGTIRYIDSKNFFVPKGNAAIELVSGYSSGIQTAIMLPKGSMYTFSFTLGDANNSCVGDFDVRVEAGYVDNRFPWKSKGIGESKNFGVSFKAGLMATPIGFTSYSTSRTKDGLVCGPVVDDVVLRGYNGVKSLQVKWVLLVFMFIILQTV